jgi:hypothetical protein
MIKDSLNIDVRVCLGCNDHDIFTSSPLYLNEGNCFCEDEFMSEDGRFLFSHRNPGPPPDRVLFNLVFQEVCTEIENTYC